jgi:cysteine dioxygenase
MGSFDGLSLTDFVDTLRRMAPTGLPHTVVQKLAASVDARSSELARYVRFSDERYTRNPVIRSPEFEVMVLCWRPGQATPIHDHFHSFGIVRCLTGPLRADPYDLVPANGGPRTVRRRAEGLFAPGAVSISCRGDIHRMGNLQPGREDLITLHTYVPPLSRMTCFDPEKRVEWIRRVLGEDGGTVVDDPPHAPA